MAINGYFGWKGASIRGRGPVQPLRARQGRRSLAGRAVARNVHLFCELHKRSRLASGCFFSPLQSKGHGRVTPQHRASSRPPLPAPSIADYNSQHAPLSGAFPPPCLYANTTRSRRQSPGGGGGGLAPSRGAKLPFSVRPSFLPWPPSCAHRVSGRRGAAGLR